MDATVASPAVRTTPQMIETGTSLVIRGGIRVFGFIDVMKRQTSEFTHLQRAFALRARRGSLHGIERRLASPTGCEEHRQGFSGLTGFCGGSATFS